MKSVRTMKPGEVVWRDEPKPVPGYGQVLVRPKRIGICGTDYNIYMGEFSERVNFPLRPGHEWSGVVDSVGEGVTRFKPGDRVLGETMVSCGVCENCKRGHRYKCTDTHSVGTVDAWPGAMSEYFLFPERDLIMIPDNMDFDQAALVEPAANALMAIDDIPVTPGMSVVIMGTGPIGLAAVAIARIYGATTVISVGRSEYKLELAKQLGATHVINTRCEDARERIMEITGGKGADVSIELSGALSLFDTAVACTRNGGTISLVAFYEKPHEININDIIFGGLCIRTAGGGWGGYFDKVLRLMESGVLDLSCLITQRCRLEDAAQEIMDLKKDNANKVKVMITCD